MLVPASSILPEVRRGLVQAIEPVWNAQEPRYAVMAGLHLDQHGWSFNTRSALFTAGLDDQGTSLGFEAG